MHALADRAARVTARHPSPALPLREVKRLVRGTGISVTDPILLRALQSRPDRFRVVNPWKGPWTDLRSERPGARSVRQTSGDPGPSFVGDPWIVPARGQVGPPDPSVPFPKMRLLRETLVHLGWVVDGASWSDLARWQALVRESEHVRDELPPLSRHAPEPSCARIAPSASPRQTPRRRA